MALVGGTPEPRTGPGSPDGWLERDGRRLLVVVKNVPWCRASETAWPPPWLYAVVQHELAATGAQGAVVGALFAGAALKVGQMGADSSYQAALARDEAAFLARIEAGNPPLSEGHPSDLAAVRELYPEDDGATAVALGPGAASVWSRCKALRAKARAYRHAAEAAEARLRAAIGQHAGARLPGGSRLLLRRVGQGRRLVEVR